MATTQGRILAFSSSRVGNGGYLETAVPLIKQFLGEAPLRIAFIAFADVSNDYPGYTAVVQESLRDLPHSITTVMPNNAANTLAGADVIMVGGGNTFKLLHDLYALRLLQLVRDKVNSGAAYIGWSAGSNLTGLTIGTTNDMPVIQPQSFEAFGFFPFQINPHYANLGIPGHHGETRDQRLDEYLQVNPTKSIVALPEGTALCLDDQQLTLLGDYPAVIMYREKAQSNTLHRTITPGEQVNFLLSLAGS